MVGKVSALLKQIKILVTCGCLSLYLADYITRDYKGEMPWEKIILVIPLLIVS